MSEFFNSLGQGLPQDYVQAHKWLSLAAPRFPDSQKAQRDHVLMSLGVLAARMTPAQIADAQKLADEWSPK
jgi:TPR repeat protein